MSEELQDRILTLRSGLMQIGVNATRAGDLQLAGYVERLLVDDNVKALKAEVMSPSPAPGEGE